MDVNLITSTNSGFYFELSQEYERNKRRDISMRLVANQIIRIGHVEGIWFSITQIYFYC